VEGVVVTVDDIDRRLGVELVGNARLSYSVLARDLGLSVNGVKKRVAKLMERGILAEFGVLVNSGLCYGGVQISDVFGWVATEGTEEEETFIHQVGGFPEIYSVSKTTRDTYMFYALVPGFEGISRMGRFLEKLPGVTHLEMDPVLYLGVPPGVVERKFSTPGRIYDYTFSKPDLLVLRCLKEDPRMSISRIAKQAGLTPRRVRKILDMFHETRAVVVYADICVEAAGFMRAVLRVKLDLAVQSPETFRDWTYQLYPFGWLGTYSCVNQPSTLLYYVGAENIISIEELAKTVKASPAVQTVDTIILYREHMFHGRMHQRVDELLSDAGL
jgi:DNA-binding Lrp family transcriptional regulator